MKTIKINKKQMKNVKLLRRLIKTNDLIQDALLERLAKDMGLHLKSDKDTLWDFVYNDCDMYVEVEK